MLVTCRSRDITSVNKILDLQPFILSLLTYLSPVYTTLNFWYGTDKSGTRTTFLVLGLPIYVVQEPKSGTVPKIERSVNGAWLNR